MKKLSAVLLVVLMLTPLLVSGAVDLQKVNDDVTYLIDNGVVTKIDVSLNEAFVNPKYWNNIEIDAKKGISRQLAFYCGWKKGNNLNWITIKNAYTGKRLAKYSESWGFKLYEK